MKKVSWLCTAFLALGLASCAVESDPAASEQADPLVEASAPAAPSAFQVVWACLTPEGARIGLPKSTIAACQAACPAGNSCFRCVWADNALECPL